MKQLSKKDVEEVVLDIISSIGISIAILLLIFVGIPYLTYTLTESDVKRDIYMCVENNMTGYEVIHKCVYPDS